MWYYQITIRQSGEAEKRETFVSNSYTSYLFKDTDDILVAGCPYAKKHAGGCNAFFFSWQKMGKKKKKERKTWDGIDLTVYESRCRTILLVYMSYVLAFTAL